MHARLPVIERVWRWSLQVRGHVYESILCVCVYVYLPVVERVCRWSLKVRGHVYESKLCVCVCVYVCMYVYLPVILRDRISIHTHINIYM